MMLKDGVCGGEDDFQETRPWWEPLYVIYGFSNPRVRSRLEKLVGTYVVRVTDKEYMLILQHRTREEHEDMMRKRIHDRELAEVEREKRLILEGKMPVEEAPEELSNHPVFKITQLARRILEGRRRKEEKKRRHKKLKRFNYDLLLGREEEDVEDMEMVSCIEYDESDAERARKIQEMEIFLENEEAFTDDDYLRIKYEDPLVEELQESETVDDLYELADEIVGPLTGKRCGGLVK